MQPQILRNAVLIALAFDATEQEVNAAHELIDRIAGNGSVDPQVLVHAQVNPANGETVTSGNGQAIPPNNTIDNPNNTVTVGLDAAGLPWDERIHSSNKKLNDKGLWWARRGVTPAIKAKVEQELRATLAAAPAPAAAAAPAPAAAAAPAPVAPPTMPGGNLPPMPGAAQPDPAYTALVQFIAQNTQSAANPGARLTDDYIKQVLTHYGVADGSLQNLAHRLDLVPTVHQWLQQALAS